MKPRSEIKAIREILGMGQLEFARSMGVSQQTVNDWERMRTPRFMVYARRLTVLIQQAKVLRPSR